VKIVVAVVIIGAATLVASSAIAQNNGSGPAPYPTIVVSLPPAPPTPSPDPATHERALARARLIACVNERKVADTALVQTAKGDGVVAGVIRRLGDTRFALDDLMADTPPGAPVASARPEVAPIPVSPMPFETPISTIIIARDAARDSSKPYWTGTRKLLDASGELEKNVRAAAAAVDKLQQAASIDPDPVRRRQVQTMIDALTAAVRKQAPLVNYVEQFILSADTQLSVLEMRSAGNMGGANPQQPVNSPLLNKDPESDGYKLLTQATDAHDATVKAVKVADDINGTAFGECAVPHPQATPQARR
jgi:hypothetical protein